MHDGLVLHVSEPFKVECERFPSARIISKQTVDDFWNRDETKPYARKHGCYVFALKAAKGYTPWYVGKATKGFAQECFTHGKLLKYHEALALTRRGTPVLFFVAAANRKNKVSKTIVDQMETFLIQVAYSENDQIRNKAKTKNAPKWGIKGVIRYGKGKPNATETVFARMMGL